ncbi:MAG: radical SAM protein [Leptolyngbya sp. PLA3]|nr:MAG: radical SAM protein [Cyanobacteria bacterium CYA]MCE7967129.1 radical SAM protein [Leptolyngbya sp. PL-A3]
MSATLETCIVDARLESIREKVLAGQRISIEDGLRLYETPDLWSVCEMAHAMRTRLSGNVAYYNVNRHLNYSNVCALSCKFCEFARKAGDPGEYTRDLDYIREQGAKAVDLGATEMHIVGGLNPYLPFEYYTDMLRVLKEVAPRVHLKAFTAVEIVHLARIAKVYKRDDRRGSMRWVLEKLIEAGLGSLPGGGAEVFDDRVHREAFRSKIGADEWLDVHMTAHALGLNSNATMLYGHVDNRAERVRHMHILRRMQDRALARLGYDGLDTPPDEVCEAPTITLTRQGVAMPTPKLGQGYYQTIIPLPFIPDGSALEHLPGPSGLENVRTLAVARLMLDNFPHAKAFWIMQTLGLAQTMLQSGADDLDGTVVWYDITKVGGASTHQETTVWDLRKAIVEAGFEPVERDTLYRRVEREGAEWRVRG